MVKGYIMVLLRIVAFLSALNILFHVINICYIIFGDYGGGAGYEKYVIGTIVALVLFVTYLALCFVKKLSCAQGESPRYVHILCVTNTLLYLIAWIYIVAFCFQW